jgi:hypothetical protein
MTCPCCPRYIFGQLHLGKPTLQLIITHLFVAFVMTDFIKLQSKPIKANTWEKNMLNGANEKLNKLMKS